jgi:hypothetical protein
MDLLTNSDIAELLAVAAESAKQPLQKALRRASRKAFLWPEEASQIVREGRSLEELAGVGPSLNRIIAVGFKIRRMFLSRPKSALDFLLLCERERYLRPIPHG